MDSVDSVEGADQGRLVAEPARLQKFCGDLYRCLNRRSDEWFELTDALLCAEGPVTSLVGLCLVPEHRRGHGGLYDALNCGPLDADQLRGKLAGLPAPRMFGGRIVVVVDVSPWLRPDAPTCPERLFCHVYGRGRGRDADQRVPGWPHQVVAAVESGPTCWTAILDAVRLDPADDATAVTPPSCARSCIARTAPALAPRGSTDHGGLRLRLRPHPAGGRPSRSGCDPRPPTPTPNRSPAAGRPTCAASTASTPSGCSSRSWAGPLSNSAHSPLPLPPDRLTPARVRRGFRHLRATTIQPAGAPKLSHPGPGRPPGRHNHQQATRYDVGKTVTRAATDISAQQVRGQTTS
ncbi:MAG TPA: transposase [Pseudonocardiaceae bacterium]|nr:transposase [Pseudonocardiaceae bacterium]